jgi:hypothetical protein
MSMTDTAANKVQAISGSYLAVCKKQSDGSWKAIARS